MHEVWNTKAILGAREFAELFYGSLSIGFCRIRSGFCR